MCRISVKYSNHRHNLNRLTYSFKKGEKCQCYRNNLRQVFVIFSPYKESIEIGVQKKIYVDLKCTVQWEQKKDIYYTSNKDFECSMSLVRPYLLAVLQGIELLD